MRDELFKKPLARSTDFEFTTDVADVFDDMAHRSIPFYADIQQMIVDFIEHFYPEDDTNAAIYDVGCSTGAQLALLAHQLPQVGRFVGIDNAQPMLDKARERFQAEGLAQRVHLDNTDLRHAQYDNAAAVVMNYTLQFVRPLYRLQVVRAIYQGLRPGGIFLLSEKVLEDSTNLSRLFIDMYYRFKRRQGYSELEISQKRERLENVLIPYKVSEQRELLAQAGFQEVEVFFKWHNFASFIAIKGLES